MNKLKDKLKDWWRGYSKDDIVSATEKINGKPTPGGLILMTNREFKAMCKEQIIPSNKKPLESEDKRG